MHLTIDPSQPRPIYVQLMDEVRRLIVLGELESDMPLPSVRQLAADLRLNPNTIVQAYRELERAGVVYVRRGHGTFVSAQLKLPEERKRILADVVARALIEAQRNGISPDEFAAGIIEATQPASKALVKQAKEA